MILDNIVWPSFITVILETYTEAESNGDKGGEDEDEDEDDEDEEDICRISGYLRMFIENGI